MARETASRMTVHRAIACTLTDHCTDTLFGLVGGANLDMLDTSDARG